jgi:ureidoglycolate hydrolase
MTRRVLAQPLDAAAWEPFGWLPRRDTDALDGSQTLHFEWHDAHANVICHRADEVPHTPDGLVCEMFFHHFTHTQALLVLNCSALIAVAPASCTFSSAADLDAIRAFALRPLDSLVLHRATWHWGPFPIDAEQVDMFNIQGSRYAEDNECARLADLGEAVEVVPPSGKT